MDASNAVFGCSSAALGTVNALVFGGGIAENTSFVRQQVCEGLRGFGVEMDPDANENLRDREGRLSLPHSRVEAWLIPAEEGLRMARECCRAVA